MRVKLNIFHLALAGLKAGDEILEINNRAAGTLNSSVLKDFLSQPSLGLLVRTYPEPEGGLELLDCPPHRADGPVDLSESPLAFLSSNPGMTVTLTLWGCGGVGVGGGLCSTGPGPAGIRRVSEMNWLLNVCVPFISKVQDHVFLWSKCLVTSQPVAHGELQCAAAAVCHCGKGRLGRGHHLWAVDRGNTRNQ